MINKQLLITGFRMFLIGCWLFVNSCKPVRHATVTSIKGKNPQFLLEKLKNNELNYHWLSAKLSTTAIIDEKKHSINIKLRIRKDSIIWMSVSSPLTLGIEMARFSITKDTLKFINRLNSSYFKGSINYLNKLVQADFNYDIIQSLLTGASFSYRSNKNTVDKSEKFKSSIDSAHYILSTLGRRKLKRTIDGKKLLLSPVQRIWLEPESFKVSKLEINEYASNRKLEVSYDEFKKVEGQLFPYKITFDAKANKMIRIILNYSKISLNKPQKFPFKIPEKYEQIY